MSPQNGEGGAGDGGVVLKKGPWTAAEDGILTEYVRQNGEGNWNSVQKKTGLARCGKSCRLRWANHLKPNLKKGAFTPEEERLIVELHAKLGNKWARMASQLVGRTDNEIKNYWNTRIKRRQRQGLPLYPSHLSSSSAATSTSTAPSTPTSPAASIFTFYSPPPRTPPLLATPLRYKPHRDSSSSAAAASFSFPISATPFSHLGSDSAAMFFDPISQSPYSSLRTHFELDRFVYSPELPSSQLFSPQTGSEITIDPNGMNSSAENSNGTGLLEDLLEEAQTLGFRKKTKILLDGFEQEKLVFNDVFSYLDPSSSVLSSSETTLNGEPADRINSMSMHEDLSKLLNFIPSAGQVPEWYRISEDISNRQSAGVTDDSIGLEMQQIASFLPLASTTDYGRTPDSCTWDNLPGIC